MNEIVFEVLKLIAMVAAGYLVCMWTYARNKGGDELTTLAEWAKYAVHWAQQVYWSETGAARKAVVLEFLKSMRTRYKIKMSDEQIEVLLEAAVKQMNEENLINYVDLSDFPEDDADGEP